MADKNAFKSQGHWLGSAYLKNNFQLSTSRLFVVPILMADRKTISRCFVYTRQIFNRNNKLRTKSLQTKRYGRPRNWNKKIGNCELKIAMNRIQIYQEIWYTSFQIRYTEYTVTASWDNWSKIYAQSRDLNKGKNRRIHIKEIYLPI